MKIAFFIESLGAGGAERALSVVVNDLILQGHNVCVFVASQSHSSFYALSELIQLRFLNYNYNCSSFYGRISEQTHRLKKLKLEIDDFNPDVIISFLTQCNLRACIAGLFCKIPVLCCEHNNYYAFKGRLNRTLRNIMYYLFSSKVTVLTNRDITNYPNILRSKIEVLPNPLGIEIDNETLKKRNKEKIILAIGRLTEQKGFDRLLKIFSIIKKDCAFNDWVLCIAGSGVEENKLLELATNLNIAADVRWLGNVKDIEKYYLCSSLFAMTSRWEGLPMVLGEAMQFSLPVIAYDCPTGPREFIKHDYTGFLIEDNNESKFIESLRKIMLDESLQERLGSRARAESFKYTKSNTLIKWNVIIDDVLARR